MAKKLVAPTWEEQTANTKPHKDFVEVAHFSIADNKIVGSDATLPGPNETDHTKCMKEFMRIRSAMSKSSFRMSVSHAMILDYCKDKQLPSELISHLESADSAEDLVWRYANFMTERSPANIGKFSAYATTKANITADGGNKSGPSIADTMHNEKNINCVSTMRKKGQHQHFSNGLSCAPGHGSFKLTEAELNSITDKVYPHPKLKDN